MKQILQAHLLLTPRPVAARGPCGILLVPHEEILPLQEIAKVIVVIVFQHHVPTDTVLGFATKFVHWAASPSAAA
jgi:hypothetical protein